MRTCRPHRDGDQIDDAAGAGSHLSLRELAHELNGLLDGSMRSIRLAETALDGASTEEPSKVDEALRRIRTAHVVLDEMAILLGRALVGRSRPSEVLGSDRPLGEMVGRVIEELAPLAERHGIDVTAHVDDECGDLPTGPLAAILRNGIRNAIEACSVDGLPIRRVDVSAIIEPTRSELTILISDTGTGIDAVAHGERPAKPRGQGIGLGVCRDLLAPLGGRIRLTSAPFGGGSVLEVHVPLSRLAGP